MRRLKELLSSKERDNVRRSHQSNVPVVSGTASTTVSIEQISNIETLTGGQEGIQGFPLPTSDNRTEKYGLFRLHPSTSIAEETGNGQRNLLDIVAVHGVTGDAYNTWKHENGNLWLQHLIPKDMPGVRVFSYGYPAEVFFTFNTGNFDTQARSLLEGLNRERRTVEVKKRPIIFVCHSMGGIVVKKALIISKIEDQYYDDIRTSVNGILFLATPHRGSSETQFPMVLTSIANLALSGTSRFVGRMRSDHIKSLEKDSKTLKEISTSFRNQTGSIKIASFVEQSLTPPAKSQIVDDSTGVMDISGERIVPMHGYDHRSICRFASESSEGYKTILNVLRDWADELNQYENEEITSDDSECLQSFSFPHHRRKEADQAYSGTCQWILQHSSYTLWVAQKSGLLWIKGKPGSGKSTLMAFIYRKYLENHLSKKEVNLHFFFHGRGTELQKTPVGMFRSLIHQLYKQASSIRSTVRASFLENKEFGQAGIDWEWHHKDLEHLFSDSLLHVAQSRAISIFIDALDEAGASVASQLAEYFHDLNNKLVGGNNATKIIISSRHYPIVAVSSMDIHVEDENNEDISEYVNQKLSTLKQDPAPFSTEKVDELVKTIVGRARGVWQWARLVTQIIIDLDREGASLELMNERLNRIPGDLGEVYDHILEKVIKPENKTKTLHLIQWVWLAEWPLSVTELRYAIASDDAYIGELGEAEFRKDFSDTDKRMEKLILSLSGGLVEVKHYGAETTVQFIHQSVNDFLHLGGLEHLLAIFQEKESTSMKDRVIGRSQDRLCKSCINYFRLEKFIDFATSVPEGTDIDEDKLNETLPFADYATRHWFLHAEKAENTGVEQQHVIDKLGSPPGSALLSWINIFRAMDTSHSRCPPNSSTLLHITSASNLRSVVRILGNDTVNVNRRDSQGRTPLYYAARWGHSELTEMLLKAGAKVDVEDCHQNTPLVGAAGNGYDKVVEVLLEQGAAINKRTGVSGNALQAVAANGNRKLVCLLLVKGADVNAQGGYYGNALQAASEKGNEAVARRLLVKGADVNAQGGYYGNALQAASSEGNEAVVKLLLEKGADVNAQGGKYGNALHAASSAGEEAVVKLLLKNGAERSL